MSDEYQAGRELDALVAEKVMGWRPYGGNRGATTRTVLEGYSASYGTWPRYSTDIAAAWRVVERLPAVEVKLVQVRGRRWYCGLAFVPMPTIRSEPVRFEAKADTAPLAICRAALIAVEAVEAARPHNPLQAQEGQNEGCPKCGQRVEGQAGEYPCEECGLPQTHDAATGSPMPTGSIRHPPQGYRRIYAGLSRPGDLQYCHEHGWEPCTEFGMSIRGFNALATPEEGQ